MKKLLLLLYVISLSAYCYSQNVTTSANNAGTSTSNVDEQINALNAELKVHFKNANPDPSYWQIFYDSKTKEIIMSDFDKASQELFYSNAVEPKYIKSIYTYEESSHFSIGFKAISIDIESENALGDLELKDECSMKMLEGTEAEINKIKNDLVTLFKTMGATISN